MDNSFEAVILSSGLSERMGQPKALLRWNKETTFAEHIINEFLLAGCRKIIFMINKKTETFFAENIFNPEVEFIVNPHPELGRFFSAWIGLSNVTGGRYCFVHNVDNPFIDTEIISGLYAQRSPEEWCSPVYRGRGGHPVLLPPSIIEKITATDDLNTRLDSLLSLFPVKQVEFGDDNILRNINTPEDYDHYFK